MTLNECVDGRDVTRTSSRHETSRRRLASSRAKRNKSEKEEKNIGGNALSGGPFSNVNYVNIKNNLCSFRCVLIFLDKFSTKAVNFPL